MSDLYVFVVVLVLVYSLTVACEWVKSLCTPRAVRRAVRKPNPPAATPVAASKPVTPIAVPKPRTPIAVPKPSTPIAVPKPSTPIAVPQPSTPVAVPQPSTPIAVPKPSTIAVHYPTVQECEADGHLLYHRVPDPSVTELVNKTVPQEVFAVYKGGNLEWSLNGTITTYDSRSAFTVAHNRARRPNMTHPQQWADKVCFFCHD